MTPLQVLKKSDVGKRTAEEEQEQLRRYFVETEQWARVFSGDIDIVYGPKGSGKSAIYSLISQNKDTLAARSIIILQGENPQGAPAFRDLRDEKVPNEAQFVYLWKLYTLGLIGQHIRESGLSSSNCTKLVQELEYAELIPASFSLSRLLRYVVDYIMSFPAPESVEAGTTVDPVTLMPSGVTGRIVFREPGAAASKKGIVSVDELYEVAAAALAETGQTVWVVLDRLDVAFPDGTELERNALRGLFQFYNDVKKHHSIRLKIFLRSDIWNNITEGGFREASHIERSLTISWSYEDMTNLVVRRALSNDAICEFYGVDKNKVFADYALQEDFLKTIFPDQVESGSNKPKTALAWILGRTKDATEATAPRELIHFLNELRSTQVGRYERGQRFPADNKLFEQTSFKEALPIVSKVRLEQTIYAEFPDMKPFIERLREQKATQPISNLQAMWGVSEEQAHEVAAQLEKIGIFQRTGAHPDVVYKVPFLYRPELQLVQGSAETVD